MALGFMSQKKEKSRPADWLIGTWRSDKEATVAAWGKSPPGSPAFQKILLRHLGRQVVEFFSKVQEPDNALKRTFGG
jgi:hypothetical protein